MYEFRFFVTGQTPKSRDLIEKLVTILQEAFDGHYHLDVIDIVEKPELAEQDKILATPTLEKVSPEPVRRIVGDLLEKETLLLALGLTPQEENKQCSAG